MTDDERAAFVDATARVMGLAIEPYRDGVLRYFAVAAGMAAIVEAYPLGPHDEPIETFVPADD